MAEQPVRPAARAAAPSETRRETIPRAAVANGTPRDGKSVAVTVECSSAQQELEVLIRARYPIIYVVSWEEERVEKLLAEIALKRNKKLFIWTCTQGVVKPGADPQRGGKIGSGNTTDPLAALDTVLGHVEPAIFLFKDFHPYTDDQRCNTAIIRRLRDVAYHLRDSYKTIVIVAPLLRIAPELTKDVTLLDFGLPDVRDFHRLLDRIIEDVKDKPRIRINLDAEGRERLLRAAQGLTLKEAENVFAKTLVLDGKIDADDVQIVFSEKQQIIKKTGLLEYYESKEQFGHVAGLDNLKHWLRKRSLAFSGKAAEFCHAPPKGRSAAMCRGSEQKPAAARQHPACRRCCSGELDIGWMYQSLNAPARRRCVERCRPWRASHPAISG